MATSLRGIETYRVGDNEEKRYRVRWQDGDRRRSKSFSRIKDARSFHAQLRIAGENGSRLALPGAGKQTLAEFVKDVWSEKAQARLAPKTYAVHRSIYNSHILLQLGSLPLSAIDTEELATWQDALQAQGVGDAAVYRALCVLSSIFKEAARRGRSTGVTANPCRNLDWPRAKRAAVPRVFAPSVIEQVRAELLRNKGSGGDHARRIRNATILSLLAYAGLRPGEMMALTTEQIGAKDLHITHAVSLGDRRDTKTGRRRLVPIRASLRSDLEAHIKASDIGKGELLFPSRSGDVWGDAQWKNWRRKTYNRALEAVAERENLPELVGTRPYDLGRHSHSAMCLQAGVSLVRLASIQGHSVAVLSSTYASQLSEYEDAPVIDLDQEIAKARSAAFPAPVDPSTGL